MADVFLSVNKQIAEVEESLRLIAERKAEFPQQELIPLDLIKNERRWQEQLADLRTRLARLQELPCPFRGLEYFDVEHAGFYFGRTAMVQKLFARLQETNFLVVVGPSGSGKSSLARAGLAAALRAGALPESASWGIDIFRPGPDPLRALAAPLADRLAPGLSPVDRLAETRKLADHLVARSLPMADILGQLRQVQSGPPRLLLIVDQFEEAFTLCGDENLRQAFFECLLAAIQAPWVTVILTLRADFYGRVLADERLSHRVDRGLVNVMPMTVDERRAAIEQPALRTGRRFEEGLVQRILDAIADAPGDLPLLEFALTELWARQTSDGAFTHAAYEEIGEVRGAIAKRADDTLSSFTAEQQHEVQAIFTRLVQVARPDEAAEDTRRRIELEELAPEAQDLVRRLADARLLVTGRDAASGDETIEVAHEALIRGWKQLQDWLNRDREFLLWRQRLRTLAGIWEDSGRNDGALLRDALLREAQVRSEGREADLNALEQAYIRESAQAAERGVQAEEAARQRELAQAQALAESERVRAQEQAQSAQRLRRRAVWLTLALAVALIAVVATGWFYRTARNSGEAEVRARETAVASADLAQQQLASLEGQRLLQQARQLKEQGDVAGAIAKFTAAAQADPGLKIDLPVEEADVRRQVATKLVQEGEQLAAAGRHGEAIAKMQAALDLNPPLDTPVYVPVPAGEFIMGSDDATPNVDANEKPQHKVSVAALWIMRTEVTNAQYLRCIKAGACKPPDNKRYEIPKFAREPVSDVTWDQASDYARWVGGRLPSEAEWEKACRGTDGRIYPWGNNEPSADLANYNETGHASWNDVGSYPAGASPYGLLDMVGNVWEWTNTLSTKDLSAKEAQFVYPYRADDGREDPKLPGRRVIRSGSFMDPGDSIRCAARDAAKPTYESDNGGFRIVLSGP